MSYCTYSGFVFFSETKHGFGTHVSCEHKGGLGYECVGITREASNFSIFFRGGKRLPVDSVTYDKAKPSLDIHEEFSVNEQKPPHKCLPSSKIASTKNAESLLRTFVTCLFKPLIVCPTLYATVC